MSKGATGVVISPSYFRLVKRFPLRRLRDDEEHAAALAIVDEVIGRGDENLDVGEVEYLQALGRFVEDYERVRFLRDVPQTTPRAVVKFLMEQRNMTPSDLGKVLGSASAASMILHGSREPSKAHVRKLAEHFEVSPAVFL